MNYERLYEYRFRGIDQKVRQAVWNKISAYLYREMGEPKRVLDPAAGRCEFINAVPAEERWVVDEVDYAAAHRAKGVKLITANILDAKLPEDYFDGIFVSNFLEHLSTQEQVASFLEKMKRCLKPGGVIAVMGPNFKYCASEYFDCADHTLALTHVAVAEHLHAAGLTPTKISPRFLPYSFRGLLPPSPALTELYLRLPIVWPLLGKQFLLIAKKPAA
ncbi:MAG: class I SAM-dependent methyltransferase [Elusimicrobiota bacterium]